MFDHDLGSFLRSRREAITPEEVGLPAGTRRRTPGLRRAELATLAGISVDYLTRLEQGRDRHPSAQVLAALAEVLRLSGDDLEYLRALAAVSSGTELCPAAVAAARSVRPAVRAILEALEPVPAFVVNHLGDVLAWTEGYSRVAGPLGVLDDDRPNLLRFTFGDRRATAVYPDWDAVADEQVANLQAVLRPDDPEAVALRDALMEIGGEGFRLRWRRHRVAQKRVGTKRLVHPEVGELRVDFETLQLADADDQRLIVYLPADEATTRALDRLTGRRPGALRAVGAS